MEPPSFAPAGEAVSFAHATENEFALAAECPIAANTALLADELALAGNPPLMYQPFREPSIALAGDPTELYALLSLSILSLVLRHARDVCPL